MTIQWGTCCWYSRWAYKSCQRPRPPQWRTWWTSTQLHSPSPHRPSNLRKRTKRGERSSKISSEAKTVIHENKPGWWLGRWRLDNQWASWLSSEGGEKAPAYHMIAFANDLCLWSSRIVSIGRRLLPMESEDRSEASPLFKIRERERGLRVTVDV